VINYIQLAENELEARLKMRGTPYEGLLQVYALLVFVVGERCTKRNIHDAWSSWQNLTQPEHRSLLPFDQLTKEVQRLDETYRLAVVEVARAIDVPKRKRGIRQLPGQLELIDA
jgi:hypothetical protein